MRLIADVIRHMIEQGNHEHGARNDFLRAVQYREACEYEAEGPDRSTRPMR